MLEAIHKDLTNRFHAAADASDFNIMLAYSGTDLTEVNSWKDEVLSHYPDQAPIMCDPLSLSVSCHIGDGAIAIACAKKLPDYLLNKYQ